MVTNLIKVLMIGNSFSICVLKEMPQTAAELGCKLDIASLYIGGCPLSRHAGNIAAVHKGDGPTPYLLTWNYSSIPASEDPPFLSAAVKGDKNQWHANIPAILSAEKWDVVTIQQASHESWKPASFHPWADRVIEEIHQRAPQAKIVIQQTWSYCNADKRICSPKTGGAGTWGFDQLGMYERLTANYKALAETNGFEVIPMGKAVQLFRERRPVTKVEEDVVGNLKRDDKGVLSGDTIHLNSDGHYLQACVWTAKLFDVDVTKLKKAPKSMRTPSLAPLLRQCAQDAVKVGP